MADGMGLGKTVSLGNPDFRTLVLTNTASMHRIDVDATQAVLRSGKNHHSEMCDCMSVKFGW